MMITLQTFNPFRLIPAEHKLTPHRLTVLFGILVIGGIGLYTAVSYLRHRKIQQQLQDDQTAARALLKSGNDAFDRGDFADAINFYTQALGKAQIPSLRNQINYDCCNAYLRSNQLNKAIECYDAFLQGNLNSQGQEKAELALEIGKFFEKAQKSAEARGYYDQAKAALPLINRALVDPFLACSQAYLRLGEFASATECCTLALTPLVIPHNEIPLRLQLGAIEEMQDKPQEAFNHYRQAEGLLASLDQGHLAPRPDLKMKVWVALSRIYRQRQDFAKALEYCEKVLTAPSRPSELLLSEAYYSKGWILFDQNKHLQAEEAATTAGDVLKSSFTPQADLNAQIFILKAHILRKKGENTQAEQMEREALALLPSEFILIELHLMRALSYYQKNSSEISSYSSREVQEYGEKNSTLKAFYLLNQALVHLKQWKLQEAEQKLREAATCSFDKPLIRELLRYIVEPCQIDPALSGVEILGQTIRLKLQETVQRKTQLPTLGQEAYNNGDYPKAARILEAALKIGKPSVDLYLPLVKVYQKLKKFGDADAYALRALDLKPDQNIKDQLVCLRAQIKMGSDEIHTARSWFEQALQTVTDPDCKAEIQKGLIQVHQRYRHFDKALEVCQALLNESSNPQLRAEIFFSQSITLMLRAKTQEAEQSAQAGLKLIKEDTELKGQLLILLSMIHAKQQKHDKALEEVSEALKTNIVDRETLVAAHLQRALCWGQKKPDKTILNYPEAVSAYDLALKLVGTHVYQDKLLRAYILFRRAQCHASQLGSPACTDREGIKLKAKADFEAALALPSNNFVTLNDLLYCVEDLHGDPTILWEPLKEKIEFGLASLKGK
ncbi:MAG: tetratricopeptide repeat protein [Verrucomicrobia bacterium]|nr:tetratricopeptide repeat protein [Verrucomicrobiota bacterium]